MVTRKPELSLVGELVSQGGTCCSLQVGHGQACLQGHPQHLQFHDQFTPACYEDNLKVFSIFENPWLRVTSGYAVFSLPFAPPFSPRPVRWPQHASCPFGPWTAFDLPETSVLSWRGSAPRDLESWPDFGKASQVFLSRGILPFFSFAASLGKSALQWTKGSVVFRVCH